jgi:hypothetical protein
MIPDTDLDTLLAAPDEDAMPAGDTFDDAVVRRVERHRARRRLVLAATGVLAGVAVCVAFVALPASAVVSASGGAGSVVSILLLVGLCAVAWVGPGGVGARREPH